MHSKAALLRPTWRSLQLLTLTSIALCIIVVYNATWSSSDNVSKYLPITIPKVPKLSKPKFPSLTDVTKGFTSSHGQGASHPINQLISEAENDFKRVLKTEAKSLEDAAASYRKRRRRHPPPGFDAWYNFATDKGAVIVEDFFDQIYHDLRPFWSGDPHTPRHQAYGLLGPKISIRDGKVAAKTTSSEEKINNWLDMLKSLASQKHVSLPDVDMPLNINDEPSLVVPWLTIDTSLSLSRSILASPEDVTSQFSGLEDVDSIENATAILDPEWMGPRLTYPESSNGPRPYWSLVQPACHPLSESHSEPMLVDIWHPQGHTSDEHSAINLLPQVQPNHTVQGYVKNWTIATDPCRYPYLQGLHGAFVRPEHMAASSKLFPLFSTGKLSMNNDILLPSAADWNATDIAPAQADRRNIARAEKENKLFWRGPATGGQNSEHNWQRFHRQRFVSMVNASQIGRTEQRYQYSNETLDGVNPSETFRLQQSNPYRVAAQQDIVMAEWMDSFVDVAFTDLHCDNSGSDGKCPYNDKFYLIAAEPDPSDYQRYKYTPILDGNGADDGAGFLRSLKNGMLPIRASVYRNWYDSRLFPWQHFVPMDNTFVDFYGIMEYFLGSGISSTLHSSAGAGVGNGKKKMDTGFDDNAPEGTVVDSAKPQSLKRAEKERPGHDAEAKKIAEQGHEWAEKVLRKEDMMIYAYRLVLEYARVLDDRRERLGWVGDLLDKGSVGE